MKFTSILILFIYFTPAILFAKNNQTIKSNLSGTITDATTHQNLQGATIIIHDTKIGAISKQDGSYQTTQFASGKYLVEVNYQGYASIIESIEIIGSTIKNFSLKESITEQDAVTVTGTTSATKMKNNPQPVVIISKTDLFKNTSTNIIDALAKSVSGLSILSTGPAISKPIIRGLGYNRMVTINDGIRQEGQQWGDEHGIEIDEASVQKAEVLKGASSLMYGSDAMAGVLNLISNLPIQQQTIKANINAGYLDNNKMITANTNLAAHLKNGFNFNVYSSYKSAADYKNKVDGNVLNSRFKEQNFGGYIGLNKHWGFSHLIVSNFNQTIGIIEGSRDSATGLFTAFAGTAQEHIATNDELNSRTFFTPYQTINHFKIGIDNSINLKKGRVTFNAAFQQNKRKEFGDNINNTTPNLFFDLQTINYNIQYHFIENNNWKTTIGLNGMAQRNNNKAAEVLIPKYNQFDMGGFAVTKKMFNKITVVGGVRYDYRSLAVKEFEENGIIRFNTLNKTFTNFSGSIGMSYNANNKVTYKLNVARGFRSPSVSELSSNGTHEGTNRYEYGDNNLKSETSLQIDAGVGVNSEHVSFSINTFYNSINNYIFYNKLSSNLGGDSLINVDGENITAFQFNQSNALLVGFEANLDIHPHPLDWLHLQNSFSYVRGVLLSNNHYHINDIPFMPQPRLLSEIKADFKKINSFIKNAYLKFEMDNLFAQNNIYTLYNTETTTPAYTLLNLGLGADILQHKKTICSIYFSINNITDIAYQNHLSRLKYTDLNNVTGKTGVFNMGRNISLKVNVPLSFNIK